MTQDEIVVTFPKGLPGIPDTREFRLLEPEGAYPLKFLHSTTHEDVSLTCLDAAAVKMDYQVPLAEPEAQVLALESEQDAMVLLLAVVPEDPRKTTANLAGPLVINTRTRTGVQVVLDPLEYPLQFPVFAPKEDLVLEFPSGLLGFPEHRRFYLFEPLGAYPLKFLQAVDAPEVSFSCIDVAAIRPDFSVSMSPEDAQILALEQPEDALVLALVVIPADPRQMTANLAGPLVVNTRTRVGRQIVLDTEAFPLKFPIVPTP